MAEVAGVDTAGPGEGWYSEDKVEVYSAEAGSACNIVFHWGLLSAEATHSPHCTHLVPAILVSYFWNSFPVQPL